MSAARDYYHILGISPSASAKEVKTAFRQMALKYHPDHNPNNPLAREHFAKAQEAYGVLSDPKTRKKYDETYRPSGPTPGVSPEPPPQRTQQAPPTGQKTQGNLRYNLFVNLEDVVHGCDRSIRFVRQNRGKSETLQIKVQIPKGAFHHQRLKISGYGDVNATGAGDLFVIVHLQNHPLFLRKGLDLRVNVPITYLDAALGNQIEVPTLTGLRKHKLKAGVFEDISFVLKGFGLPDQKPHLRGDLHVHCFVENLDQLSPSERQFLQGIQKSWPRGELMQQYQDYLQQFKRS